MEDLGYAQVRARCSWHPLHRHHDSRHRVRSVVIDRYCQQQQTSDHSVQNVAAIYSCVLVAIIVENALRAAGLWIVFDPVSLGRNLRSWPLRLLTISSRRLLLS